MAAVATINAGYERFIIGGFGTENNVRVHTTGPTYATTTGTFSRFGSSIHGSTSTTFGGETTYVSGTNDAQMQVIMLNRGDPGFEQGIDAKEALGPEWQKKVEKGINNCLVN